MNLNGMAVLLLLINVHFVSFACIEQNMSITAKGTKSGGNKYISCREYRMGFFYAVRT